MKLLKRRDNDDFTIPNNIHTKVLNKYQTISCHSYYQYRGSYKT